MTLFLGWGMRQKSIDVTFPFEFLTWDDFSFFATKNGLANTALKRNFNISDLLWCGRGQVKIVCEIVVGKCHKPNDQYENEGSHR